MSDKLKNIFVVAAALLVFFGLSIACVLKPDDAYSEAERRALAQKPEFGAQALVSGEFMEDFEAYAADQFPLRDGFRSIKAFSERYLFLRADNNDIVIRDGAAAKLEYPLNEGMIENAADKFRFIYESFFEGTEAELYLSVVPDKNYYLAQEESILSLDYERLTQLLREKTDYAEYIDLFPVLELEDYYGTDSHWRQECITDAAQTLLSAMGAEYGAEYSEQRVDTPFYGVYCGQAALPLEPDELVWLSSPELEGCRVTCHDSGVPEEMEMYDLALASGRDGYEMYLCGAKAIITVENPAAEGGRELVLFRDSFGSSIAPLLAQGYAKITLVDIRYVSSAFLGALLDFSGVDDVLFLYSAAMLNNSSAFR